MGHIFVLQVIIFIIRLNSLFMSNHLLLLQWTKFSI